MDSVQHIEQAPQGLPPDGKALDAYRLVFDMNPQPMWIWDVDTLQFLAVNEAAVLKYEYSRKEFLSITADAIFAPGDVARFVDRHRADLKDGADETEGVWRHCSKTGRIFEVEVWSRTIPFQGRPATLTVVQDITPRRRAESSLSTRYALTRLLTESTGDVLAKALRCLCESLEFDMAELWLLDPAGKHLFRENSWYRGEVGSSVKGGAKVRLPVRQRKGTLPRVCAYGTPCWIPDAGTEPGYRSRREALSAAGITSGLAFAVRSHEAVRGVVVLLQRGPAPADPQILQLLADIGSQIGHYLERSRVEQELREAEASLHALFDESPIPCHEIDANGTIVRVNQAQCEVFGKHASEMIGKPVWDLMVPAQREESRQSILKKFALRRTGPPFERKFVTRNGTESVFRVHDRMLFSPQGEVTGIRGAMLDLTESRRSRRQIELQTTLLDQANDAILTVDHEFRIQYCNGAAERLFGWVSAEAIGQRYKDFAGTVVTDAERQQIHHDILARGSWNGEIICTKRDGSQFVVHVSWSVLHDSNGNIEGIVGIHRDITAPKQMEQALRATEDRLKLAQSALALGTWELDLGTGEVQCSDQLMRLYGRPGEAGKFTWEEWQALLHPQDRDPQQRPAYDLFVGRDSFDQQTRIIWPDGSVHWLHSKSLVIRDELQRPTRMIGVDFDITEHKRTEERLHMLSSAVEQSPISVLITGMDGKIQYVNARLTQSTGYTADELLGQYPTILASDDTPAAQRDAIPKALHRGQEWRGIMHARKKNGELFWESVSLSVIRDAFGRPTHQLAVAEDITERLEMEAALKLSEERFRIAAESSGDSIYEWDMRSGLVTLLGRGSNRATDFGWTPPWQSEKFLDLVYPADRERIQAAIRCNLESGEPYKQEYRMKLPSGELRYYADQGSALRDKDGKPYKWIGVCRDVTEEKRTERANAELAAVVECADAAIISKDLAGDILTWNRGAERIYGFTAQEMIGHTMAPMIPDDRIEEDRELMERVRRGESVQHLETTRLTRAGALIHVLLTISPIRDRNGTLLGVAHVAWDITQIKHLERQLAQTQKLESIGHLAAGIAHEINTPIQYIGDNGKFLEDAFRDLLKFADATKERNASGENAGAAVPSQPDVDEGVLDYLRGEIPKAIEQLIEGVDQVARIVRAMKEFSHPGPVEMMPVDINRAIESTILVSKNEWKYVAEITTDLDPVLPPVPCVAGEFNQVILNLIVNAAHAIGDVVRGTGEKGSIHIRTRRDGEYAEIRISDTGGGIPESVRSKVFDPFFTTKPVGQGTGQGLAIAHAVIVQKHHGLITFESETGRGTTFLIKLPFEGATEEA